MADDGTLRFLVRHRKNRNARESLASLLESVGLQQAQKGERIDLLIVHRNTDAPEATHGIDRSIKDMVLRSGGIYLEYTLGGRASWNFLAERQIFGEYKELMRRLGQLREATTLDELRTVLQEEMPEDKATEQMLVALVILCQGYLAVHADEIGNPRLGLCGVDALEECTTALEKMEWKTFCRTESAVRDRSLGNLMSKQPEVTRADWWSVAVPKGMSMKKLRDHAGGKELNATQALITAVRNAQRDGRGHEAGVIPPRVVARAYLELHEDIFPILST